MWWKVHQIILVALRNSNRNFPKWNKKKKKNRLKRLIELQLTAGKLEAAWCMCNASAAAVKSLQSCPTLCDPIDGSPPGSPIPGFLQARTLDWVAISSSRAWKWKLKVKSLSHVRLFSTAWSVAYQTPPSMGFSRQEYWSGVPLSSLLCVIANPKEDRVEKLKILFE